MDTFSNLWNALVSLYSWLPDFLQVPVLLIVSFFVVGMVLKLIALIIEAIPII